MKKFIPNILILFISLFALPLSMQGQSALFTEDFNSNTQYSVTQGGEGSDGTSDYFFRTDGMNIDQSYTSATADFFAGQDVDDGGWTGSASPSQLTWSNISISGYSGIEFSGEFASIATDKIDNSDYILVEYQIDGGGWNNLLAFENDGATYNTQFGEDTNFDGTSDGADLTGSFLGFTKSIASTGSSLDLRITIALNSGGEDIAFDEFQIVGTTAGPTVGWDSPSSTETETNSTQTISIPVSLSNYSENVDLDVTVTGGTAEAGDYTLNTTSLSFTGNGTENVSIDINSDADSDDETVEITLTESTSTGITIVPDVHTLTILDDDSAPLPTAFINELHYNNDGADVEEFVEVALINSFSDSLSDITLTLYNGSNGEQYGTETLNNFTDSTSADNFTFYTWLPSSIQNGDPDGLALSYQGTVIEFLSYGGTFTATDGPAIGEMSTDIGVSETGSTPIGQSLQRIGDCDGENCPTGLTWTGPISESPGDINTDEILPVEWLSFSAERAANRAGVRLDWTVASEEFHDFYEIQRSTNGAAWTTLGQHRENPFSEQAAPRGGDLHYQFFDEAPLEGLNLYRIRQVDIDGAEDYSSIEKVLFFGEESAFALAPNPARDRLYFTWPADWQEKNVEMELISMQGQSQSVYRGEVPGTLRLPHLQSGIYQLLVRDPSGQIIAQKRVIIQ